MLALLKLKHHNDATKSILFEAGFVEDIILQKQKGIRHIQMLQI